MNTLSSNHLKRVCIIGNSGSGKSTLADDLGAQLLIPVYHLDQELLYDNFIPKPKNDRLTRHAQIIAQNSWIIDGNYPKVMYADRLARATLVVFLDISRFIAIPRVLKRYIATNYQTKNIPDTASNGISWKFAKWVVTYSRRKKLKELRDYCNIYPHIRLVVLHKGTLNDWIKKIVKP